RTACVELDSSLLPAELAGQSTHWRFSERDLVACSERAAIPLSIGRCDFREPLLQKPANLGIGFEPDRPAGRLPRLHRCYPSWRAAPRVPPSKADTPRDAHRFAAR